jgi:hypothetical protein
MAINRLLEGAKKQKKFSIPDHCGGLVVEVDDDSLEYIARIYGDESLGAYTIWRVDGSRNFIIFHSYIVSDDTSALSEYPSVYSIEC